MPYSGTSPVESQSPIHIIRDEERSPYDAGSPEPKAFWFVKLPRIVSYFARIMRDGDITQVYTIIAEQANAQGQCFRTHEQIANDAGVSPRKVRTVLQHLVSAEIVTLEHGRFCNGYTLIQGSKLPSEASVDNASDSIRVAQNVRSVGTKRPVSNESHSADNVRSSGTKRPSDRQETSTPPAGNVHQLKTKTSKTIKTESPLGDSLSESGDKPKREPTRIFEVAEWYANRVGGVIPGKAAREWADAKRLADTGITNDDLGDLYDWLAGQTWVKSLSLGLMASKFNEWRSTKTITDTDKTLPRNDPKSGRLVF